MFADQYIQNNVVYRPFIADKSSPALSMVLTIPCLNEPEIIRTLESLWQCEPIDSHCEVLVCVNDSEDSSEQVKAFNRSTYNQLMAWKVNNRSKLILHPIYAPSVKARFAGAGMARKIVMDEAIRRLNAVGKPEGVIVALDADCLVSGNYLKEIERVFTESKSCFAATLNFRHRCEELTDPRQQDGIRLYENYLHYYKQALDYTGFPNSIYTIGSAFAVRADAYVKQGGMNRRKAGEDFYFLNKLTHLGKLREITNAWVYPSARVSDRVPFGTGAAMSKWMNHADDLALTYRFEAFEHLKQLFDKVDQLYRIHPNAFNQVLFSLPPSVQDQLNMMSFEDKLKEINRNSSTRESFRKRFFQVFDAFQVMKYLNRAHESHYSAQNLYEAIAQLREAEKEHSNRVILG